MTLPNFELYWANYVRQEGAAFSTKQRVGSVASEGQARQKVFGGQAQYFSTGLSPGKPFNKAWASAAATWK